MSSIMNSSLTIASEHEAETANEIANELVNVDETVAVSAELNVLDQRRRAFYEHVETQLQSKSSKNSAIVTDEQHATIIQAISDYKACATSVERSALVKAHNSKNIYRWTKTYDVCNFGSSTVLIFKQADGESLDSAKKVLKYGDFFDGIRNCHEVETGNDHPKSKTLYARVSEKYGRSVPRWICEDFPKFCAVCVRKAARKTAKAGHQPILTRGMNSRVQIDLIDYQSMPDGPYKYILVYQDHGTKFCILRPLTEKTHKAVARVLLDIFSIFGPPSILQTDNGREFSHGARRSSSKITPLDEEFMQAVIKEIKEIWPETVLVTGMPRHSESDGAVERRNRTVEDKVSNWIHENNTNKWAGALPFVQFRCNTQIHRGIGNRTPYHLQFGQNPQAGISNLPLDKTLLLSLSTEKEVLQALGLSGEESLDNAVLGSIGGVSDEVSNAIAADAIVDGNFLPHVDGAHDNQESTYALSSTDHGDKMDFERHKELDEFVESLEFENEDSMGGLNNDNNCTGGGSIANPLHSYIGLKDDTKSVGGLKDDTKSVGVGGLKDDTDSMRGLKDDTKSVGGLNNNIDIMGANAKETATTTVLLPTVPHRRDVITENIDVPIFTTPCQAIPASVNENESKDSSYVTRKQIDPPSSPTDDPPEQFLHVKPGASTPFNAHSPSSPSYDPPDDPSTSQSGPTESAAKAPSVDPSKTTDVSTLKDPPEYLESNKDPPGRTKDDDYYVTDDYLQADKWDPEGPQNLDEECSNEPLRPGDKIEYYNRVYVSGDPRGKRDATVIGIDCSKECSVEIDNGEVIENDQRIKRVEVVVEDGNGGVHMKRHRGLYRDINHFVLIEGRLEGDMGMSGIMRQAQRFSDIYKKNLQNLEREAHKIGFYPMDLFRKVSHRSQARCGAGNNDPPSGTGNNDPPSGTGINDPPSDVQTISSTESPPKTPTDKLNTGYRALERRSFTNKELECVVANWNSVIKKRFDDGLCGTCDLGEELVNGVKSKHCKSVAEDATIYFDWKTWGIDCGVWFQGVPVKRGFGLVDDKLRYTPFTTGLLMKSVVKNRYSYQSDVKHAWLSILQKVEEPLNREKLSSANINNCFAVVEKDCKDGSWRRVIIRKVRKAVWEILDEYSVTVLDTVEDDEDGNGPVVKWDELYRHPALSDYTDAVRNDMRRKEEQELKALRLDETPNRKRIRDDAYDSMRKQGRQMKQRVGRQIKCDFNVGTIVQIPLDKVDTTKADGKTLTLVVVEKREPKGNGVPMYRLACKAGVLDRLYHPSYLTPVACPPGILGLDKVADEYSGMPVITVRQAARSVSIVGGQGKHLGCKCKIGKCRTKKCSCFADGRLCTSSCHGGLNTKCRNIDEGSDNE